MHALTRGISQLATPFFVFQAKPSTIQRQRVGWLHFDERLRNLCTTIITSGTDACYVLQPSFFMMVCILMSTCACLVFAESKPHSQSEIFSKEVIRPQVPLRPPCYDFSPLIDNWFDNTNMIPPRQKPTRMERRAVCARSGDVFTARW